MEPHGKKVVRQMDVIISAHIDMSNWKKWGAVMLKYFRKEFIYDCVPYGRYENIHEWYSGEHTLYNKAFDDVVFTQLLFLGTNDTASTTTYAKARWVGPLMGVLPGNQVVTFRICDYYSIPGRISYNFMMFDVVDIFRQAGLSVLPPATLPEEGYVSPSWRMDGIPAPLSAFADPKQAEITRALALKSLTEDWQLQLSRGSDVWHDDMEWYGPAGFGVARGMESYRRGLLAPMHAAMGQPSIELKIVSCEGDICGVFGHIKFTQVGKLLGQNLDPTGQPEHGLEFRFSFHCRSQGGKLIQGWAMFDIPGLFRQWGIDLYDRARVLQEKALETEGGRSLPTPEHTGARLQSK